MYREAAAAVPACRVEPPMATNHTALGLTRVATPHVSSHLATDLLMPTLPRPRVLLAEDDTLLREGIRQLLCDELDVVDAVGDGQALLRAAVRIRPDAILLNISMPLLNGLDAARQLARLCPGTRLVFVTSHTVYVQAAFDAGGHGYVVKMELFSQLIAAVRAVLLGRHYVSPSLFERSQRRPVFPIRRDDRRDDER